MNAGWRTCCAAEISPSDPTLFEKHDASLPITAAESDGTGVGGPSEFETPGACVCGGGLPLLLRLANVDPGGVLSFYPFLLGVGFWAHAESGAPVTSKSINWVKNQTRDASTWAKDGLVGNFPRPCFRVGVFLALLSLAPTVVKYYTKGHRRNREVELANLRLRMNVGSPSRRSSSGTSKSPRKSSGLPTVTRPIAMQPFRDSQQMISTTFMCQAGSIYCLHNPRQRLISRACATPSSCRAKLTPPERNYALKDDGGDPRQADLCWNCKQEYVIFRKGLACSVSVCTETAIPLDGPELRSTGV